MTREIAQIALVVAAGLIYVLPSLFAVRDKTITADHVEAMIVNAMLGWTVIGWFFALFLAFHRQGDDVFTRMAARNRRGTAVDCARSSARCETITRSTGLQHHRRRD